MSVAAVLRRVLVVALAICGLGGALALTPPRQPMSGATLLVRAGEGHGSGVHIGDGLVLTAAHVVAGAGNVSVRTDRGEIAAGELLWVSARYDIASLRASGLALAARRLRCTDPLPGEPVAAAGNPLALEFVTFFGHAGGPARIIGEWPVATPLDLTVAPGMSGGPLLDRSGDVVGIVVATHRSVPIGVATPGSVLCGLLARRI